VQVRGGQVGNGILLGAGDHLEAEPGRVEVRRAEAPPVDDRAKAPAATDTATSPEPDKPVASAPTGPPKAAVSNEPTGDSWKTLARAGNYEEALAAADRDGFDDLIARLPAVDVALLADAARLAGDRTRARRALLTLRRRFPGIDASHLAAFRLGRLALAEQAYGDAAGWFRAYLAEVPSGALADEATGRLIEAQARAGDRNGARATAEKYLERFPGGPYESLARGMLRGDKLVPRNEGRTVHE
jgi:TolA-binding protein